MRAGEKTNRYFSQPGGERRTIPCDDGCVALFFYVTFYSVFVSAVGIERIMWALFRLE